MLIGQSAFQSVLTRLKAEEEENGTEEPQPDAFRINGLASGFVAETADQTATSVSATGHVDAYFETAADARRERDEVSDAEPWPEPLVFTEAASNTDDEPAPLGRNPYLDEFPAPRPKKPTIPPHLLRLSEDEVAEDLAIASDDSEALLADKRRNFARSNHPDRVAPEWRNHATTRMKIANRLIDAAITGSRRR